MNSTTADSTFTIARATVQLPKSPSLSNSWMFWPLGDIHLESPNHDKDRFNEALAMIRQRSKKWPTRVLLMGDDHDAVSTKERKALAAANLHESTIAKLDGDIARSCDRLIGRLEFLGPGGVVGAIEGNHHWVFSTPDNQRGITPGMTSTQYIAKRLETKWLGFVSYLRIAMRCPGNESARLDIAACHGVGGGRVAGTTITNVDRLRTVFPSADIYLMGHDHARGAWPVVSLVVPECRASEEPRLKQHEQWLCRTGSFLRGYVENETSYVVRGLYRPASLGVVGFRIVFNRKTTRKGGARIQDMDIQIHPEL